MTCHSQLFAHAEVLEPVRESLAKDRPIAWTRVHALPDYVYFDHSIHVAKGVGCTTCHGEVERMPLTRQATPMTMGWCLDCHRNPAPHLREPEPGLRDRMDSAARPEAGGAEADAPLSRSTRRISLDCSVCHR